MQDNFAQQNNDSAARRRQRLALGWLVVAVLALQACGGGDDNADAPPPASGGPTPTPAPSTTPTPAPGPTPTSSPSPAPPAAHTCGLSNFQSQMLQLVNARRAAGASCGSRGSFAPAAALAWNTRLTDAAYGHSRDMADNNYFSHTSLDGRTLGQRVTAAGYSWSALGENIAGGPSTVQQVVDGWMASDGHCANIMNANFTEIGVACASNASSQWGRYWTMDLARPR
jgi:uncharacterized protein YkwD